MRKLTVTDSSNVAALEWQDRTLTVEFKGGGRYRYENVPLTLLGEVAAAESVGRWVNVVLVNHSDKHPCTKLSADDTLPPPSAVDLWVAHSDLLLEAVRGERWKSAIVLLLAMHREALERLA